MKKLISKVFRITPAEENADIAEQCGREAEMLYRSGKYHCAEAVLEVIRKRFRPDMPEEIVQMVSGFGRGSGSGCICGAVSGATVAIGLALQGDKKRISAMTTELHKWFKEKYGATCCKTIRTTHTRACPLITAEAARKTAEKLYNK